MKKMIKCCVISAVAACSVVAYGGVVLQTDFEAYTPGGVADWNPTGLVNVFPLGGDVAEGYYLGNGSQAVEVNPEANGNTSAQVLRGGDSNDNINRFSMTYVDGSVLIDEMTLSYDFYNGSGTHGDDGVRVALQNFDNTADGFWIRNDRDGLIRINGIDITGQSNAGTNVWQRFSGVFTLTEGETTRFDFAWTLTDLETTSVIASGTQTNQNLFGIPVSAGLAFQVADAVDGVNFQGYLDNISVDAIPGDTLPPVSVDGTYVVGVGVELEWSVGHLANTYNVYRSTTSGSYSAALASGISATNYTDATAPLGTNYYVVTSVDAGSAESDYSDEIVVVVDTNAPAAPTGLVIATNGGLFELSWNANAEPDIASYSVYRSTVSGVFGAPVEVGVATNARDTGAPEVGVTYYYVVTALDATGNESAESAEVAGQVVDPTAECRIFMAINTGEIFGFNSMASNALNVVDQETVNNGILLATVEAYTNYQAFATARDKKIYGVNGDGDVLEWDTVTDWLAGEASATTLSTGNYDPALDKEIHGVSYDPATRGYYAVLEAPGDLDGDVVQFADLAAFVGNSPYATHAASYGGNIANFYYGYGDVPSNVGWTTNLTGASYFSFAGNGTLEGYQSLDDYIAFGTQTFQLAGVGARVKGAFAFIPNVSAIDDAAIAALGANDYEVSWLAESNGYYAVQFDENLQLPPGWSNVITDIYGIDGVLSVTTAVDSVQGFFRVVAP
jgi:fibronectin type 3 domain-containing protein